MVNTRREQIARAAARLFLQKRYDKASIREIAQACNMSIGTLYHYIGSKEDILSLVFEFFMARNAKFCEDIKSYENLSPKEALGKTIARYYRGVADVQDMALLAYQDSRSLRPEVLRQVLERERDIIEAIEGILIRGCEAGEFKIDNVTLVANNVVVLGDAWAFRRWLLSKKYTVDQYIEDQTKSIMDGIASR